MQPLLLNIYSSYFCVMLKLKLGFEFFRMLFMYNTDVTAWIISHFADEVMLSILAHPTSPNNYTVSLILGW